MSSLSPRLAAVVDALPLRPGLRVLEVGCGPGAAARAVAERVAPGGFVLAIDRSARSVTQARRCGADQIARGVLGVRTTSIEDFELDPDDEPFDLAFAVRVGALDGRHPSAARAALARLAAVLTPEGRVFIDGGDPLREIEVPRSS